MSNINFEENNDFNANNFIEEMYHYDSGSEHIISTSIDNPRIKSKKFGRKKKGSLEPRKHTKCSFDNIQKK